MTSTLDKTALPTHDIAAYKSLENSELAERIQRLRAEMGSRLLILGHHYQQDEVIALTDLQGDSYQLASLAASHESCRAIAFCGVHFMAETADILANRPERLAQRHGQRVSVILPDLTAGCSLADMAQIEQVEDCWQQLADVIDASDVMPITYVNSAASLKAFCGRHGGIVCTSANARAALDWAFARRSRVLFFPDQHLGRNTAKAMGIALEQMSLWDPREDELGGNTPQAIQQSRVLLWRGYCSVHQVFLPRHVQEFRQKYPGIKILVHPECSMEVVDQADVVGSTGRIIRAVEEAPPGTKWAIGT
ncbi:MAG TPA: quinolinate synthase NadA, partial [Anaerolineae bacterium]